jgi:hypothetical protein
MPLNLSSLEGPHLRTVDLPAPLEGFAVEIRHVTMTERERWRRKLIAKTILKKDGSEMNDGRLPDFVREWCELYAVGWHVPERFRADDTKDKNPPFDAAELSRVILAAPKDAWLALVDAAGEEADFFSGSAAD